MTYILEEGYEKLVEQNSVIQFKVHGVWLKSRVSRCCCEEFDF
jgi:hypothetical protein